MNSRSLSFFLPLVLSGAFLFLGSGCSRSGAGGGSTSATSKADQPNFVIILMDDLGWADVGFNGSTYYQTPNLDRMAARSVQFKQAYAPSPVCSPTRASLLTGQHPARMQITDWLPGRTDRPSQKLLRAQLLPELPLSATTLPEALKRAGYTTAHIGKWHLGGEGYGPLQQGFDTNIAGDHSGTPINYFYPYRNRQTGKEQMVGLEQGTDGEYLTDRLTDEAERFLTQQKGGPFLLYLAHYAVHIPMRAKQDLLTKYQQKVPTAGTQRNPYYAAMIESMDQSVGRILRKLEELGLDQNTVVIFTSDNGGLSVEEGPNTPATSNYPLRDGKGYLYEGGIRVPLLVLLPKSRQKPYESQVPVTLTDLYPTLMDMAGTKSTSTTDGKSLVPLLQQRSFPQRPLYWHYPHYSNQGGRPGWAIREGDYKLIEFFEDGSQELYNLKADPGEQHNLLKENPKVATALTAKLHSWRKDVNAQMMKPNTEYKGEREERRKE
ncbi:sulfatase [Telluribacter sp. SYSU D00476]|uniref:sulfatase n=1 Tax=Telluribacter sp. SYSU D00476 TaxID=2811430 RepID=UPI001FF6DA23|nr:sulfatase [Telluribacter sp. SYSU D00476]